MLHNSFFFFFLSNNKNYQCPTHFSSDYFLDPLLTPAVLIDYPETTLRQKIAGMVFIHGYLQKTNLLRSEVGETGQKKKVSNKADYYSQGFS